MGHNYGKWLGIPPYHPFYVQLSNGFQVQNLLFEGLIFRFQDVSD